MGLSRALTSALTVVALAAGAGTLRAGTPESAEALAAALQKHYAAIHDFSADFTHTYRGGVLRKQIVEKGHLLVRKPLRMRWEYTDPEKKLFVSDGTRFYSYLPEDRQVLVSAIHPEDTADTSVLFLAGRGDLVRDFDASDAQPPAGVPPGTVAIKLVPRKPQTDYDWLILAVDPRTLALRGLVTADDQGGQSSFVFTNLKENVGVPDDKFTFKIPRGVDVITDAPAPTRPDR